MSESVIAEKIKILENNIEKLSEIRNITFAEFNSNYLINDAAKYNIQISVECMIDIAEHIVSKKNLGNVGTSYEAIELLQKNRYIDRDNLELYRKMIQTRNRIVHIYGNIDNKIIYDILQNNINDFKLYIAEISKIFNI